MNQTTYLNLTILRNYVMRRKIYQKLRIRFKITVKIFESRYQFKPFFCAYLGYRRIAFVAKCRNKFVER